jgi:hypothetical protein
MVWLIAAASMMFVAVVLAFAISGDRHSIGGLFAAAFSRTRRSSAWWVCSPRLRFASILSPFRAPSSSASDSRAPRRPARRRHGPARDLAETPPIIRDFPLTGTGAGTFPTAMLVYQQSDRRLFFNQAHNHYP